MFKRLKNLVTIVAWLFSDRRLSAAERNAKQWKRDAQKLMQDFVRSERRQQKESERIQKLFDRAERLVERFEKVEETLSSELKIYKENVIPTWALNMELLRTQTEADIALQSQRKAAYTMPTPRRREDE